MKRALIIFAFGLILSGCHAGTPPAHVPELAVQRAIDSCYTQLAGPDSSPAARAAAAKAERLTGQMVDFKSFSLFVPRGVATPGPNADSFVVSSWSSCPGCRFGVTMQSDSGVSLEKRIAERVAEQKRIDSVNADPNRTASEFDEMFGPPSPFIGRAGRGYVIDEGCGDCVSITVQFARPSKIATISYGFDDDIAMPWRHHCEMDAMARSFVFKQ